VTLAHNAVGPNEVWSAWNMSPLVIGALVVAAIAYLRGLRRLGHAGHTLIGHRREAAFYAGLVCAGVALLSPLDALSDTLFSAHMVQHLVLILCAAPLVIYGAPTVPLLLCLPVRFRRPLQRWRHKRAQVLAVLGGPLLVWALHTGAMWAWHQPALYEAGLRDETLHAIEHSILLVTALLVWGIAIPAPRSRPRYGAAIALVFGTALQSGALGAILTFATTRLYSVHAQGPSMWGFSQLQDQQLAGAIMWIPAGAVYFVSIAVLCRRWLSDEPRRNAGEPLMAGAEKR
jgi:putative membrane protein